MLKTLHIYALRGATAPLTITFEKNKKITIVYGENGTGKSTICDALEFLSKGVVGSLEGKGLGKVERYWHSTGKKPADLAIKLKTTKGEWDGLLNKSKPVILPDSPRPQVEILRRHQILKLVTDQANKRYDAIKPFIDIEGIEKSEAALRKLVKEENDTINLAAARLEENQIALDQHWEQTGKAGDSALSWAKFEIAKDATQLNDESLRLQEFVKVCSLLIEEDKRMKDGVFSAAKANEELQSSLVRLQQEQARITDNTKSLVEILTAAQRFFQQHPKPNHCPLCGSAEFASELPSQVADQLRSIRSLESALKTQQTAEQSAAAAQKQVERQLDKLLSAAQSLANSLETSAPSAGLPISVEARQAIQILQANPHEPQAQTALSQQTQELLARAQEASSQQKQKIGFLTSLRNAVENYETNFHLHQARAALLPNLESALASVEQTRRQFVDDILRDISQRVGELYEAIHPGEGLDKVILLLDPDKRASLEIRSDFPGTQDAAPPGAYFSESHLDTLGLCIWLAMAERENPAEKILVLDDVIGSVDEQHAERTVELLYQESQKYQHCLLTTHYRPWREKYRWGWLKNGECHFVELINWEHASGIRQGECIPPVNELKKLLEEKQPSPQIICASAGVILEAILDFLTLQYECAVPRRKTKPTLGDLLPNVKKNLRHSLRVERPVKTEDGKFLSYESHDLGPLLNELESMAQLRNIFGCHFNQLANYLSPGDAVQFASTVHKLADLLIDPESGWPMSDKSGSYWSNSNQTIRLHPLKQPK
jgi:energy-coupling factor transporter ATP-binding protein EcfA2